jgi:glutamate synthase domain-containing protein 2/glutamate synthase domain-containing protein 1/glutamate synthase domain-containing protein 3
VSQYRAGHGERDACGIGFVADAEGRSGRAIVDAALDGLCRVKHRGAVAADARTGDGAGLLLPVPRAVLHLDDPRGGVAMLFFRGPVAESRAAVEDACAIEGLRVSGWRRVPVDAAALGDRARDTAPTIEQAFIQAPAGDDARESERRCWRARRRIERAQPDTYVASMSFSTVTYKALCAADQLGAFYPDLADDRCRAWFAIFHQRYSTNTTPTWERAQPFRFVAHNGEINTIRGNIALLKARLGSIGADQLAPSELLRPIVDERNSDSGILDEALELLVRGGRDVRLAATMLIPPAWEGAARMAPELRAFLHYSACLMEPWDGPAGLVFSDGFSVNAALDRNGLRPLRVAVCDDGFVACASEAGAISTAGHGHVMRRRLGPGEMLSVDPEAGGVVWDDGLKHRLARTAPYGEWLARRVQPNSTGEAVASVRNHLAARRLSAGYSKEEITVVLRPMATGGAEPTSSMGDDTPQPPMARWTRGVFSFLKQRFAQVTNPPIDHLRERHVMSITTRLGRRSPLLADGPASDSLREYESFLLFPSAVDELEGAGAHVLHATFDVADGPDGLETACRNIADEAARAVRAGAGHVIVTDRDSGPDRCPVPSALAAGAVHHRLIGDELRAQASIIVDCDDAREAHHVACLLTNGTDAVCPRLALETIYDLASTSRLGGNVESSEAQHRFFTAIEDGVLKIMSKMGISTLDSYRCAQIIEAVGLGGDVVDLCFAGMSSPMDGLSLIELGADAINRHHDGWSGAARLVNTGVIKFKRGGEHHGFNPDVVDALHATLGHDADRDVVAAHQLQRALRGDVAAYGRFAALCNTGPPSEPRHLLELLPSSAPVALDEVEPASAIVRRFSTGAMSHGALSAEAHETLAVALNMIGGSANSGEGGEAPERYRDDRNCAIKQVASGRFGVTPEYLAHAHEIQIKMAQGSKPGEGGQLPGIKVSTEIARLRHTVPGVALISPPPHHDIYSIEDLAQLIFDLKQANPESDVSVKLVASEGIGTIAAGVAKGLADVIHISGADGGTGASPLSSIKNAGLPWEIGLADVQSTLVSNELRERVRLRVDGGMKTGRDVIVAALLGADEYSFGTAALIAQGCILVRTCHRNTCPVGIATQDEKLRAKFAGTPEMVAGYLLLVAEEARALLASLGLRSFDDAIGRADLLTQRTTGDVRADSCDLSSVLAAAEGGSRRHVPGRAPAPPRSGLGDRLLDDAIESLGAGHQLDVAYEITTADRSVGTRLGCAVGGRFGLRRPGGRVRAAFTGSAGQSFGAWLSDGIELDLTGEANDYVCKGMAGGRVVVRPPADDAGDPCLVGNTALYGATGGELFVAGRAGERFAVRNSGAVTVVEGTGDHACEYMTAGAVVILGPTGVNLGAGMSGGEAYVYDPERTLPQRLNGQLVAAYDPTSAQLASLQRVVKLHAGATGSGVARALLDDWKNASRAFSRVAPVAEVARLESLFEGTAA